MASTPKVTVEVPGVVQAYCDAAAELYVSARSVQAALNELEKSHPALYRSICDETGQLRRHINVFVNSAHVRALQGLDTPLDSGDIITILPAVSGG
jgi:molybdopterin synthase sulfur carrier subunit